MAKSKRKQRRKTAPPVEQTPTGPFRARNLFYAAFLGVVLAGGWSIWQAETCEAAFLDLAAEGQAALAKVDTRPNLGRQHLQPGQSFAYPERFPTSGPHAPTWVRPGVYVRPQPPIHLVHALEHGNIVIYYDRPSDETLLQLETWTNLYGGQWSGLVMSRAHGIGDEVVLTAWTKRLRLKPFDAAAAAAFIDEFRGRGPENPVR